MLTDYAQACNKAVVPQSVHCPKSRIGGNILLSFLWSEETAPAMR